MRQSERTAVDTGALVTASLLRLGGDTQGARLFKEHVHAEAIGDGGRNAVERLAAVLGLGAGKRAEAIGKAAARAALATAAAESGRLTVVTLLDDGYPPQLAQIPDPPIVFWLKGDVTVLSRPAVALVGSRQASQSGLALARQLGRNLAEAGLVVVSGLARGVDGMAHRGALDAGGVTVAVLGNGVDVRYPAEHGDLAREVAASGAVLAEFPPGTPPRPEHFPLRNRIISGLSRAVVVVEASERSGSLITARAALEQGRDVLAVPGNPVSGRHRGCHALIKDGARLVETVGDILEEIGWPVPSQPPGASSNKSLMVSELGAMLKSGAPVAVDELAERTGQSASEVLRQLGALEVAGAVGRLPGGLFIRLDGPATNRQR